MTLTAGSLTGDSELVQVAHATALRVTRVSRDRPAARGAETPPDHGMIFVIPSSWNTIFSGIVL
jgi:hypothetical protein